MLTFCRHFLSSAQVLKAYAQMPQSEQDFYQKIKQGIQLSLRTESTLTPDHIHNYKVQYFWPDNESLADMLLKALGVSPCTALKTPLLCIYNGKIYVEQEYFELWQREIVTYQSSVPYIAAGWLAYAQKYSISIEDAAQNTFSSLTFSSLPGIYEKRLHSLFQPKDCHSGNLCDLHTHFNGSSEPTQVWLHALEHKEAVYSCLENAYTGVKGKKARHFYKQLGTNPQEIFHNLHKAARIRQYICSVLYQWGYCTSNTLYDLEKDLTESNLFHVLHGFEKIQSSHKKHPFYNKEHTAPSNLLQNEGVMWVYIIEALRKRKNVLFAKLVHMYLLLMHQFFRLLIQQQDQYGFDQFQYVTCAEAYEALESTNTSQRFTQLRGMYGLDLARMELRFSPKNTVQKNYTLLKKIWNGYTHSFQERKNTITPCVSCPKIASSYKIHNGVLITTEQYLPPVRPKLTLVGHFIKQADETQQGYRHKALRASLAQQAQALIDTKYYLDTAAPYLSQALVGKDAAANELETPPEVFAPIFRKLYNEGIRNTTYHAGEDFEHILSGIRAVHEAMTFLELKSGDRIGHATALGIAPANTSHLQVFCKQGHWLDNLIWLTERISNHPTLKKYQTLLFNMQASIQALYKTIYKQPCPDITILWQAWSMRTLDISLINSPYPLERHTKLEKRLLREAQKNKEAFEQWIKYHQIEQYKHTWNEHIAIDAAFIDADLLCAVQDAVISDMRDKNIIVEVLPSSNVRISHYKNTSEHHVLRWLDPEDSRPSPQVVLGTDDPGIFSTNIRNEYSLIFNLLQKKYPAESDKPYRIIQNLIENSHSYAFK